MCRYGGFRHCEEDLAQDGQGRRSPNRLGLSIRDAFGCRRGTRTGTDCKERKAVTACTQKSSGGDGKSGAITLQAADDACELSQASAPAGAITFEVTNEGSKITEFYLYSPDKKVVSEVEGIGPGTSRTMTVKVTQAGAFTTACKPGMVGMRPDLHGGSETGTEPDMPKMIGKCVESGADPGSCSTAPADE